MVVAIGSQEACSRIISFNEFQAKPLEKSLGLVQIANMQMDVSQGGLGRNYRALGRIGKKGFQV